VGKHRDFKFGVQADHSKSQPMDDKLSLKGWWSCHVGWAAGRASGLYKTVHLAPDR